MVPDRFWLHLRLEIKMNSIMIVLLVIVIISTAAACLLSRAKKVEKAVKVMLFVLYFWSFVFIQLIVFALLYQFDMLGFLS